MCLCLMETNHEFLCWNLRILYFHWVWKKKVCFSYQALYSINICTHTITVLSLMKNLTRLFMHNSVFVQDCRFTRCVSVQIYKKLQRLNVWGMDVLNFQCLATNDLISEFTISGFSSCKFYRNIIIRKQRLFAAFPSSEGGRERYLRTVASIRKNNEIFNRVKIAIRSSKLDWLPWIFLSPCN